MSTSRNALGRGIGALIPSQPAAAPQDPSVTTESAASATEIPLDAIVANPDQPRRVFDDAHLETLAASIRVHGVLQPVVVRRLDEGRYELVVGERRWRASRAAGLDSIPAVIAEVDPAERLEVALIENVQRHDLNPIELAFAFRALSETGATQEEIGRRVGLDRSSVSNHLRLLDLPREYQADVESGALTTGHAKALLQVTHTERRRQLRDRILEEGLSVRAAEAIARPEPREPRPRKERRPQDPNLQRLADTLREQLQTRVRINGTTERGRIEIEYFGSEDLDRLSGMLAADAGSPH